MMGCHSIELSAVGAGRPLPLSDKFLGFGGRAASLTHQKKKKKVVRSRGRGGVEVETTHGQ